MQQIRTVITGTGCFIPPLIKRNSDFAAHNFYDEDGILIKTDPGVIVDKFRQITGIEERRYAAEDMNTSGMAVKAATMAIEDAACDPETIDQIIVAHNFGNVMKHTIQTDVLPALSSRVKHALKINNPYCIPYDIMFGCPGWIQGVIQADAYFKAGLAKKCLVIGAETLSRVIDEYDRDSMIFSDGAGACILEAKDGDSNSTGILSTAGMSHCIDEVYYLHFGKSYFPGADPHVRFMKMKGRKVYEYALKYVPMAMKQCLDKASVDIKDIKKVFLHQANEKMDESIIKALYKLYDRVDMPENIMPMSIHKLGNSSVATVPTLFDRVRKNKMEDHLLLPDDIILLASVGAGMNINAFCYRI
jgi:3-oxoacyl-[acyl-carrier-protein] synthase-3